MTTVRPVCYGEELTFDYGAVTDSIMEYQSAICLCGSLQCRGSFLHFAGAEQYQKIMKKTHAIAVRFGKLLKQCVVPKPDNQLLKAHGFNTAAFGAVARGPSGESMDYVPLWLKGYVTEVLAYIEYERRALPLSLLCDSRDRAKAAARSGQPPPPLTAPQSPTKGSNQQAAQIEQTKEITFEVADNEGRASMERRMLDLTQTLSLVGRVLSRHARKKFKSHYKTKTKTSTSTATTSPTSPAAIPTIHAPLRILSDKEVVKKLWTDRDSIIHRMLNTLTYAGLRSEDMAELRNCSKEFESLKPENVKLLDDPVQAAKARKDVKAAMEKVREVLIYKLCSDTKPAPFSWERHAAAADLLLFYQCTTNFVEVSGYSTFSSDPVMVFARELGVVRRDKLVKAKTSMKGKVQAGGEVVEILVERGPDAKRNDREPHQSTKTTEEKKPETKKSFEAFSSTTLGMKRKMKMVFETREFANKAKDLANVFFLHSPEDETCVPLKVLTRQQCEDMWCEHGEGNDAEDIRAKVRECLKSKAQKSKNVSTQYLKDFGLNKWRFIEGLIRDYLLGKQTNMDEGLVDGEEGVAMVTKVYEKDYVLGQLLSWYKGGIAEDEPAKFKEDQEPVMERQSNGLISADMAGCLALPDFTKLYSRQGDIGEERLKFKEEVKEYEKKLAEWKAGKAAIEESNLLNRRKYEDELKKYEDSLFLEDIRASRQGKTTIAYPPPTKGEWENLGPNYTERYDQCEPSPPVGGTLAGLAPALAPMLPPEKPKIEFWRGVLPVEPVMPRDAFTYNARNRSFLLKWVSSDFDRNERWGPDLERTFGVPNNKCMIGSPVLDFQISGDDTNLQTLIWYLGAGGSNGVYTQNEAKSERELVLNRTLETAKTKKQNFNWVQCDNPQCMKWRRLPWHVDVNTLPESFKCEDNIWEMSKATCDADEDKWDELAEQTLSAILKKEDIIVGRELDVYIEEKGKFCVGLIRKVEIEKYLTERALVEYRVTSKYMEEEWVTIDNGLTKFAPKNFYTKARKKRSRDEDIEVEQIGRKKVGEAKGMEGVSKVEEVKQVAELAGKETTPMEGIEEMAATPTGAPVAVVAVEASPVLAFTPAPTHAPTPIVTMREAAPVAVAMDETVPANAGEPEPTPSKMVEEPMAVKVTEEIEAKEVSMDHEPLEMKETVKGDAMDAEMHENVLPTNNNTN